nr:ATP-dependent DNA helicase RRM3-like [Coffea arabica]
MILLRNFNATEDLCNGIRLIYKSLSKHVIHAQIAVGDFAGKDVFIHRIPLQPPTDEQYPIPYIRTQFSIRLCFAMTINKAQGQTLDCVGIYLKEPVFSHGHLYVALSRARTASQVKVLIKPPFFDKPGTDQTKIIVFREVLETSRLAAK